MDVQYDECSGVPYNNSSNIGDGLNEKWYELIKDNWSWHIPHSEYGVTEIKYYFSPVAENNSTITWNSGISSELSSQIVSSFKSSMEKWNNIWYYKLNQNNVYEKRKLVNIVEGNADDHNLVIYPILNSNSVTSTKSLSPTIIVSTGEVYHYHYENWKMTVNLSAFDDMTSTEFELVSSRTGAHEIGHVLGLRDIDSIENPNNSSNYHHEEILMGYSKYSEYLTRQKNITYKDIAGVAITRGLHTDSDHKWMTDGLATNTGIKLICSICNCIKYVSTLSGYDYVQLGACGNNHNLSSNNMMPVASYQDKDYYKCKYCRYVAPFTSIVQQNYLYNSLDYNNHAIFNNVNGLSYTILEEHTSDVDCEKCDFTHEHIYSMQYYDNNGHRRTCEECGTTTGSTLRHTVLQSQLINGRYGECIMCHYMLDLYYDEALIRPMNNLLITQTSINGSYILPNGTIILVDEDLDAYLNGTLEFYDKNEFYLIS